MLIGTDLVKNKRLALGNPRKRLALAFVVLFVLFAVGVGDGHLVDAEVAVEFLDRTRGAKGVVGGTDVNRGLVEDGGQHLRSDKALPDQLVQLEEIIFQILADVFRRAHGVRRTHGFVGFLRVLLGLVIVGLFGKIAGAETVRDQFAHLREGVIRDVHGIGAHVGDERDGAFFAKLDTFIEFLRERHRALGSVAEAVVGGLLQLGSCERWRRIALLFPLRDRGDLPLGSGDGGNNFVRGLLIGDFDVFALVFKKLGFEERRLAGIEHGVDRPILLRQESADFLLAFDDQAQSHRLNAASGKATANFIPKKRGDFVAYDAVENAAGLLRVDKIRVDFPGMLEGCANRLGRDFVEGNAENLLRVDCWNFFLGFVFYWFFNRFGLGVLFLEAREARLLLGVFGRFGQNHGEVRGDGFSFAVGVARQVDGVRGVGSFAEIIDDLAFARDDLKSGLEYFFVVEGDWRTGRLLFNFLCALLGAFLFLAVIFFFAGQTNAVRLLGQVHYMANGGLDE